MIDESFDYVIVGSGAAGATVARVLADTGASLAIVEEGALVPTDAYQTSMFSAMTSLYRSLGGRVARGNAFIPVLQGACVGGSTVVNSAIVWRLPEDVLDTWRTEHRLGDALPLSELERNWELIEEELQIQPTDSTIQGSNNGLLQRSAQVLGVGGAPTHRNVQGCQGSARCQLGCPHGAKLSMLMTYIPYARSRGAVLFDRVRAEAVRWRGTRAVGLTCTARQTGQPLILHARKAVVIAASAVDTPCLLQRSGLRGKHLGAHFQAHPGPTVLGLFDEPVNMWSGATQGYDVDHHRRGGRFKIESLALPLETLLALLPGVGHQWLARLGHAPHLAAWAVQARTFAEGSITDSRSGPRIAFSLQPPDVAIIRAGLAFAAELLFAAGARAVLPLVHGLPDYITEPNQVRLLTSGPDHPAAYRLATSHLFGTARMSVEPEQGVVTTDFRVHGTDNLYVVDSSVFPTNIGVNPQHTIMAFAMLAAHRIVAR